MPEVTGPAVARPDVTAAIREAIVRGEFAPNQRLVEADLSRQFEVGRSGVRAALFELANEGLVERVQNRGARVRAVTLEEAIEISEVRRVVDVPDHPGLRRHGGFGLRGAAADRPGTGRHRRH